MNIKFAKRMETMPKSFIREILKVSQNPEIISFAGGLPNPALFPVDEIKEAVNRTLDESGRISLQYSTTEGYLPLREYISQRYKKRFDMDIPPEEILITNGSQQALDLIGKIFIDDGDHIVMEKPGYLGAIQAFSAYRPVFNTVTIEDDGVNMGELEKTIIEKKPRFFYAVPNYQNPSGITYSLEKRKTLSKIIRENNSILVEDDPYGELRFFGEEIPPIKYFNNDNTILLGSFSKTVAPGMRLGWVCAHKDIIEKLVVVKQGADLHSNFFAQKVLCRYLEDNDLDLHIDKIKNAYKKQRNEMVGVMEELFPAQVRFIRPGGGMFVWATLPDGVSAMKLFNEAIKGKVAFVPGDPFYVTDRNVNTLRLNYTNSDENSIREGIKRLSGCIEKILNFS